MHCGIQKTKRDKTADRHDKKRVSFYLTEKNFDTLAHVSSFSSVNYFSISQPYYYLYLIVKMRRQDENIMKRL